MKKFHCFTCNEVFNTQKDLDTHNDKIHNVLYVPLSSVQINNLLLYIYSGNRNFVDKDTVFTLQRYYKASMKKEITKAKEEEGVISTPDLQ